MTPSMSYNIDLSHLERDGEVSVTRQLVERFAALIDAGELEPGTKLPTTRALAAEDERIAAGWSWRFWYRRRGMYHAQLQPWLARFPRERLLLLLTEDLERDPRATLRRVFAFLGVDPTWRANVRKRYHTSLVRRGRFRRPERPALDPEIRRALVEDFREDVTALQALLGRDLSAWLKA